MPAYAVLSEFYLNDLVTRVNAEIEQGYEPLGAPFRVRTESDAQFWCQAICRPKESNAQADS
jgi:hypothetical protein